MAVSQIDLNELKRISTNTHDEEKACMNRVIRGISELEKVIRALRLENEQLRKELAKKKA